MKFKSLFLMIFSFVFFINGFSSISNNEVLIKFPKEIASKCLEQSSDEFRSLDESQRLEKGLENEELKYIPVTRPGVNYVASAFYAADYFYLGVNQAGAQDYSLMRAKINPGATVAANTLQFVPLAPQQAYLNGIKENDKPVKKDNPIYNKRIEMLALQERNPILTSQDTTTVEGVDLTAGKRVCLVADASDGSSVKTNVIQISDANGANTDRVVGLAASSKKIFAAVKSNAGSLGDGNGGFAVLDQKDNKLVPIDATTGNAGNKAFKLSLEFGVAAAGEVRFAITQDAKNTVVLGDMYWDANLERLFIGSNFVERNNNAAAGGGVSVLVGRLDGDKLIIEPAIGLDVNFFNPGADDDTKIIAFYKQVGVVQDSHVDAYKLRTMKTSTGKDYLIVNGNAFLPATEVHNFVFALPIVGTKQSDGTDTAVENVGKIAAKTDINHDTIVQNIAGMHLNNDLATQVGAALLPILADTGLVEDVFIINDSVFVCVAGARGAADQEAGIFRSTALFDNNGNIRAWSPWQRVMGTIDKTYGAGFDINTGNYWYFTDDGGAPAVMNTVKVTQWGKSSAKTGLMGNGLVKLLSDEFTQENAGVHQIFNFDEKTPSIARTVVANEMSFMAALGYKKVALIESGKYINVGGVNAFTPTDQFVKDTNVFVLQDNALSNLGPICCAEVSRINQDNMGWLFIGGYNGVAVWRNPVNGNGWDGQVGSGKVDFATLIGAPNNFSFKEIGDFSQVRKLICDTGVGYAYIMTVDNIYRFGMDANKFDDAVTAQLDEKTIFPPPGYLLDMVIFYRANNDTRLLVATTQGLFYSNANGIDDNPNDQTPVWTRVALNSGVGLSNPVAHLSFIDTQKGGYTTDGNLYALSADLSLNLATIYRFDIQGGVITTIPEVTGTDYFYSIGELRTNFLTDGALGYSMLSKHFGQTEFLCRIRMISDQSMIRRSEASINIDLESSAYNIGVMVQNTASGGWVVPGDWGIRVNE